MKAQKKGAVAAEGPALAHDPLGAEAILERFYRPERAERAERAERGAEPDARTAPAKREKPTHYKIVCISLYTEDIERLEALVAELKRRGHTKANKSQVIRAALDQIDLAKIPKGY